MLITLDSNPNINIKASVKTLNQVETKIDGVSVYEVTILLDIPLSTDVVLTSGMSGKANLLVDNPKSVLLVPSAYVFEKMGKKYVKILNGKKKEDHEVSTGETGTDGMTEIITGITEGQEIYFQ